MDIFNKIYPKVGKVAILIMATIAIFTISNPLEVSAVGEFDRWAGSVTDANGAPLSATIRIGTIQARSYDNGKFDLYVPRNYKDSSYVINVESHGYVPISQIHIGEAIQNLNLQMQKAQLFEINPKEDFSIRDDRGTQIAIKSGSLVDANGNPATGPLQLSVYTYDVTSEEMVGNMSGLNSAGELVSMESVGAFFAEFTDKNGNEYNLGQGSNAEISIPNDPTGNFPTTVPLWSYNTETGLWVEEGQATLEGDRYVGDVSHFSFWNFDAEKRTPACIRLTVDPDYLHANKPIQMKALLISPTRTRYLNVVQDTNVLINLPVNTNVEFYIPTTATTPFAVVNTGAPWGGTGIPSYPHGACNGELHIDGSHNQGKLWGTKFHDVDGNGVRDSGEPGLSGWTITATDANGNNFSTVTDINGNYRLMLSPGGYSVVEVQQPGWTQTFPATPAHSVTIEAAKTTERVDFGNTDQGRLWGKKFHDVDGDGVRDADEPGLPGWTITATDANGNSFSTVTDANGNYSLRLSPGVYWVIEVQQPGWTQTFPATTEHTVTVEAGKTTERVDFGNMELCQGGKIEATGAIYTDTPPADIGKDVNESDDTIIFTEVKNFVLTNDLDVDITTSGTYTDKDNLSLGTLTAGTTVNSHLIRLDPEKVLVADMTVKFSSRILGIIVRGKLLLSSQALARPGVNYPVGSQLSGLEFDNDRITLHPDMRTIDLHLKSSSPSDNIRVITEIDCQSCSGSLDIETAGVEFLTTPLSDVSPNANERDHIILFAEKSDFMLPNSGIAMDITAPGTYDSVNSLTPAVLSNNALVNSHLLRFDPNARARVTGTVKFNERILGVIVTSSLLDSSDLLGHPDVTYPRSGIKLRGIEINKADSVIIHPDMQTLELNLQARSPGDHIRVITASCSTPPTAPPPSTVSYYSSSSGGKVSGVRFADEDILAFDSETGRWAMYFDGSDVGLGARKQDLNAFHVLENGDILLSTIVPFKAGGVTYDDSDIVRFVPTSLGSNTAGEFKMYLDGSDVKLTTNGEDISAIAFAPNGDLVISTLGNSKTHIRAKDDDLLRLKNGSFGTNTSGTWSLYFDGSDAGFTKGSEDIWATSINTATEEIHISTAGNYNVSSSGMNLTGDGDDVFVCIPASIGSSTKCTFRLDWNGDDHGFGREKIDGYSVGTMPSGLIFSASAGRVDVAGAESVSSDTLDDIAGDDVLEEEDVITRLYLPVVSQ